MEAKIRQAYKQEIIYQTKQFKALQIWLRNMILCSSLGIALILFGKPIHPILFLAGIIITVVSIVLSLVIGLALHKGNINLKKIYNILDKE